MKLFFEEMYKSRNLRVLEVGEKKERENLTVSTNGLQLLPYDAPVLPEDKSVSAEVAKPLGDVGEKPWSPRQLLQNTVPEDIYRERHSVTWIDFILCQLRSHDYIFLFSLRSLKQPRYARFM